MQVAGQTQKTEDHVLLSISLQVDGVLLQPLQAVLSLVALHICDVSQTNLGLWMD